MREIGKALFVIYIHAEKWLVDASKNAICGFSAGAHNCSMYLAYWNCWNRCSRLYRISGRHPARFSDILEWGLTDGRLYAQKSI